MYKAHRLVYHSTLGVRVIKKKKMGRWYVADVFERERHRDNLHVKEERQRWVLCECVSA